MCVCAEVRDDARALYASGSAVKICFHARGFKRAAEGAVCRLMFSSVSVQTIVQGPALAPK